eukprot:521636_1
MDNIVVFQNLHHTSTIPQKKPNTRIRHIPNGNHGSFCVKTVNPYKGQCERVLFYGTNSLFRETESKDFRTKRLEVEMQQGLCTSPDLSNGSVEASDEAQEDKLPLISNDMMRD